MEKVKEEHFKTQYRIVGILLNANTIVFQI
jgi:hypothetical protein